MGIFSSGEAVFFWSPWRAAPKISIFGRCLKLPKIEEPQKKKWCPLHRSMGRGRHESKKTAKVHDGGLLARTTMEPDACYDSRGIPFGGGENGS